MLTRENILNGDFLRAHEAILPAKLIWDEQRIMASMLSMLQQRPKDKPVWVFAYGSLMWNPMLIVEELRRARLLGWQRRFSIRLISGRATPTRPGRMLSLEENGQTDGIIFRLSESDLKQELMLVWVREMITGLYQPKWLTVTLDNGDCVNAIVFVSDPQHPLYEFKSDIESVLPLIHHASGSIGSNADYVFQLERPLASWQINDGYIGDLAYSLRAYQSLEK